MSHARQAVTVCLPIAFGLLVLNPSTALASDFGPMIGELLFFLAVIGGVSLLLGVATSAVLVWACRRKQHWFLVPVFAVAWFVVIFGGIQFWMNYLSEDARRYRDWKPPKQPVQMPVLAPEGTHPVPERQDEAP